MDQTISISMKKKKCVKKLFEAFILMDPIKDKVFIDEFNRFPKLNDRFKNRNIKCSIK